jgi:two-component system sensor histidine kinase EvgS
MEKTALGDPVTEYLKEIQLAAGRSADITRQLLAFARKQTIQPRFLDLNEALEAMLKMLRRLINEDVNLRWFPHPFLPWVNMDPSQISQILMNLCMNAKDAISEGGTITIETRPVTLSPSDFWGQQEEMDPGEYVLLMVSDTGHGMDKETLELLFEPFFSTKSIGKGTGLGLSTVYGIVKQNRGRITVYSEPGIGTTFRIYLPACQKKDLRERRETGPLDKSRAPSAATIIVVEDEPSILKLTKQILERIGYTVLTAESPKRAVEAAINHPFEIHLLITDVVMPGMNGRELAKKLLTLHPTIKCLFMSGYTANVIAHHGVIDDGVHFIQKPFTRQELAVTVLKALGRSE